MFDRVWILILAAGISRRMGSPKQLLQIKGESMIRHVTRKALSVGNVKVAVIGNDEPLIKEQCIDLPIAWVENNRADQGISASIRVGIEFAMSHEASAAIIILGDQPDLDPGVMQQLIETYRQTQALIVQVKYVDRPGHPVLFDQSIFPKLLKLEGDSGARQMLKDGQSAVQFVEVPHAMPRDLDTPKDYEDYLRTYD